MENSPPEFVGFFNRPYHTIPPRIAHRYDSANTNWVKVKNPSYSQAARRREFLDRQRK
jgi:hypothetical protein